MSNHLTFHRLHICSAAYGYTGNNDIKSSEDFDTSIVVIISVTVLQITPAKNGKPVQIELVDTKTKEVKETLEVIVVFTSVN